MRIIRLKRGQRRWRNESGRFIDILALLVFPTGFFEGRVATVLRWDFFRHGSGACKKEFRAAGIGARIHRYPIGPLVAMGVARVVTAATPALRRTA